MSLKELYSIFEKYYTKYAIVDLDENFNQFLENDSIYLDQESKKLINDTISKRIMNLIEKFDYVFVKLNEKAPIDANYMLTQLKCFNIDDIISVIKSSERCLENFDKTKQNFLILKEWYKIEHKFEFRCYFINKKLKGISQRYIDLYEKYDDIDKIRNCIINFVNQDIKDCLDKIEINNDQLNYMIIDLVYAPKRNKVKIIDVEILIDDDNKEKNENENNNINNENINNNNNNNKNIKTLNITEENSENEEENEIITNSKFNNKLRLYSTWDELINVDDEDNDEIELRYITSENDERILQNDENKNRFPIELYDSDFQTVLEKLNLNNK